MKNVAILQKPSRALLRLLRNPDQRRPVKSKSFILVSIFPRFWFNQLHHQCWKVVLHSLETPLTQSLQSVGKFSHLKKHFNADVK